MAVAVAVTTAQWWRNASSRCSSTLWSSRGCNCTLFNTPRPSMVSFTTHHSGKENERISGISPFGWKTKQKRPWQRATRQGGVEGDAVFMDKDDTGNEEKWDYKKYEALIRGGEEVSSVMREMVELLEDMTKMDEQSEETAVKIAAQGVVGQRVEKLDASFMMALDFMIAQAEKELDDRCKWLLEVLRETVLSYLAKKLPPHVQVVALLCRTPDKDSRQELLRRVAAGGGIFDNENGDKVELPGANLNDIANQADDLLETMEERPVVPDRKLLARLVLIREEARTMMGGGILDERNDRGLSILPDAEVAFVSKLVALKPGPAVREMILNVMRGKNEGADTISEDKASPSLRGQKVSKHSSNQETSATIKVRPVRPGIFLETVTKVLTGMYESSVAGVTVQHLEWVHRETLKILQKIAFE